MAQRATRRSVAKRSASKKDFHAATEPTHLSDPPINRGLQQEQGRKRKVIKLEPALDSHSLENGSPITPNSSRKRARKATVKKDEDIQDLPHNLGDIPELPVTKPKAGKKQPPNKPKKSRKIPKGVAERDAKEDIGKETTPTFAGPKRKAKNNSYGLTPGQTPYPNWPHPTAAECEEVNRLLSSVHGKVTPPKSIPMPSLTVSGCGEVPSVLDALIRTRLSAATSNTNSSRAFAGLVAKFGVLKEGVGKGSVDWNKVRLADTKDIFEAIKSGGLADVKSKDIKKILQMVWEENQARREALMSATDAPASFGDDVKEKEKEVARADENVISLDHMHLLSNDDAFDALTKYPGIGPKTASCVMLFCLQRPSFAVDTHVFRLCQWLGWVPPSGDPAGLAPGAKGNFSGPTRNSTYAHCEVRIPDELKYPLHTLFIKHGKSCPRCRAITGESSEGWDKGCVIDHLVKRTGGRKGTSSVSGAKINLPKARARKTTLKDDDTEEDTDDLSDLVSDNETSVSSTE